MGLEIVELVMKLEKTFEIELPDDDLRDLRSVGELYLCLERRLADAGRLVPTSRFEGALWERYLDVVQSVLGLAPSRLRPEAHFVRDLGAD